MQKIRTYIKSQKSFISPMKERYNFWIPIGIAKLQFKIHKFFGSLKL